MLESTYNHLVITGKKIMNRQRKNESDLPSWWRTKWEIDDWEESVTYVKAILRVFLDSLATLDKQPIGEIFCADDDAINNNPDILLDSDEKDATSGIVISFNRMSVAESIVEEVLKHDVYKVSPIKDNTIKVNIGKDIQGGSELVSRLLLSRKGQPVCMIERECYLFQNEKDLRHFHEYFKRISL